MSASSDNSGTDLVSLHIFTWKSSLQNEPRPDLVTFSQNQSALNTAVTRAELMGVETAHANPLLPASVAELGVS